MKKILYLLPIMGLALAVFFAPASAVSLGVSNGAHNQLSVQKATACSSATVNVGASVSSGVIVTNIPAACIGQTMIVRLTGGLLGITGIVVEGPITATSMTFPNATLSALLGTVGALTGVQAQVMVNGWYMHATWVGVSL